MPRNVARGSRLRHVSAEGTSRGSACWSRFAWRRWVAVAGLACALVAGCDAAPRAGHEALLDEYQRITDQATRIIQASPQPDAAEVAQIKKLAEQVMNVTQRKLMLVNPPTAEQMARYDALAARFQAVMHAACPTCPK